MFDSYPQQCIKCHRSNLELDEFPLVKTKFIFTFSCHKEAYRNVYTKVPVCKTCKSKFIKYQQIKSRAELIGFFLVLSLITTIILFFIQLFFIERLYNIFLIFLILSIVLALSSIIIYSYLSSHPDKISNYVNFKRGTFIVKSPDYRKAIVEHAITRQIEDNLKKVLDIDIIHCPKCGSKQKRNADFCLNCGKELRNKYII
ncbi:MAG: hypothetical protein ACFFD2_23860 [Promethearchaeota archaeon]